tara:strand:- start:458 stop:892 length:435 start_codon:yes stop_codon:yes gene_type:complete
MVKDGWRDGFQKRNAYLLKSLEEKLKTINLNLQDIYDNQYDPANPDFIKKFRGGKKPDWVKVEYDQLFKVDSEHIYTRLNVANSTTSFFINMVNDMTGGSIDEFRKDEYFESQYQSEMYSLSIEFDMICEFLSHEKQENDKKDE